jgi:hypothetical protein
LQLLSNFYGVFAERSSEFCFEQDYGPRQGHIRKCFVEFGPYGVVFRVLKRFGGKNKFHDTTQTRAFRDPDDEVTISLGVSA